MAIRLGVLSALALCPVACVLTASVPSAAAASPCAAVTGWAVTVNTTYYFVGGVSSYLPDGSEEFGTVSLSVSGTSFHAVDTYIAPNVGYVATFTGTLSAGCRVAGTWTAVPGAGAHGLFTAHPLSAPSSAGTAPAKSPNPCNGPRSLSAATGTTLVAAATCTKPCDPAKASTHTSVNMSGIGSFDVLAYSDADSHISTSLGASTGRVAFSTITLTKEIDEHTAGIWQTTRNGTHIGRVTIQVFKPCATTPTLTYTLDDVIVDEIQLNGPASPTGNVSETMKLHFERGDVKYSPSPSSSPSGFKIHP